MATKKITKKIVADKKVAKKPVVEMVSYSVRMVIPTAQYANIQPEIIVKGGTPEEAHAFLAPHMNKLWKEYFMISERPKAEPAKTVYKKDPAPETPAPVVQVASPIADVALLKATQAIQSCLSSEALDLIIKQIGASVKLTAENKASLLPVIEEKSKELNG